MDTYILPSLMIFIITSCLSLCLGCKNQKKKAEEKRFYKQLGSYCLDINKTHLGSYAKDSSLYKNLTITFKDDSTFILNMSVPFIYDTVGIWTVGVGLEEWNWLFFQGWKVDPDQNSGNQFDECCLADGTFLLNGATPKPGAMFIQEIWFKRKGSVRP